VKYAKEVIDLLGAYPGRRFKMTNILNHVAPRATGAERNRVKIGVWRALNALRAAGSVACEEADRSGAHAEYWWESVTPSAGEALRKPSQYARALAP
jgi:hypothetical protein